MVPHKHGVARLHGSIRRRARRVLRKLRAPDRLFQLPGRRDLQQVHENHRLQLKAGFVQSVGQHRQQVVQHELEKEPEKVVHVRRVLDVLDKLEQDGEPGFGHVALRVLKRPDDRVDHDAELGFRRRWVVVQLEQRRERVAIDGGEQSEKVEPRVGEIFKVVADHVERDADQTLHNQPNRRHFQPFHRADDLRKQRQHLRVSRFGN
mmetsp:Transcript_11768/g.25488  ORF Transcript_11768/g.25488 Transcript_11768/m.25488 type:complete len:206 (+) Transcript_11768:384-1001(+)